MTTATQSQPDMPTNNSQGIENAKYSINGNAVEAEIGKIKQETLKEESKLQPIDQLSVLERMSNGIRKLDNNEDIELKANEFRTFFVLPIDTVFHYTLENNNWCWTENIISDKELRETHKISEDELIFVKSSSDTEGKPLHPKENVELSSDNNIGFYIKKQEEITITVNDHNISIKSGWWQGSDIKTKAVENQAVQSEVSQFSLEIETVNRRIVGDSELIFLTGEEVFYGISAQDFSGPTRP